MSHYRDNQWPVATCISCNQQFEHPPMLNPKQCPGCFNDDRATFFERPLPTIDYAGATIENIGNTIELKELGIARRKGGTR